MEELDFRTGAAGITADEYAKRVGPGLANYKISEQPDSTTIKKEMRMLARELRVIMRAGEALTAKVREQVAVSGAYQAARNLRKQGFSLKVALAIVAGRF